MAAEMALIVDCTASRRPGSSGGGRGSASNRIPFSDAQDAAARAILDRKTLAWTPAKPYIST